MAVLITITLSPLVMAVMVMIVITAMVVVWPGSSERTHPES